MNREAYMNINKTKYRYLMDCLDLTEKRPIIKYTIPVPKGEEKPTDEFFDRDYPDVTISNKKFVKMIDKTANALIAFGIKKGDIVTVCQTNTPEIMYMDYALSKIGAMSNYIYPNVTADEMRYYIDELDSKYMFILDDAPIRKNVQQALKDTDIKIISSSVIESFPKMFKVIASKKMKQEIVQLNNETKWNEFIKNGKSVAAKEVEYTPKYVCSYVHTSGTSSVPKAIIETNENVNAVTENYFLDKAPTAIGKLALQTIPQFVEYGKTTNHIYFCNNFCMLITPEMDPRNYYDLVKKYKPAFTYTTPSHIRELIKRPVDMNSFVYGAIGGDGFDDVEEPFNEYMLKNKGKECILQGYGASEVSAVVAYNLPNRYKVGSLGKLAVGLTGMIIEPDTFNVLTKPNTIGELCVTGPTVTLGYAGNSKDETDKIFVKHPDGTIWVHLGDYISVDEDGFLYYHGRIKNVIARKSFKFSPKEIDDVILTIDDVLQSVTVAKYHVEDGQVPSTHIVLKENADREKTIEKIISVVNESVQEFHRPAVYKIQPDIIRTRNNKVNINALRIEDNATLPPNVIDAEIFLSADKDYDYDMKVFLNKKTDEKSVIDFIEKTAKNEKILNGKISYEFVTGESNNYIRFI